MNKKRSNMRDVARAAEVSVATVSRVLNSPEQVSEDTKARVLAAVEALNFVPSPAARSINSGRSFMVGALVPTLAHEIFARFLHSVETQLSLSGYSLVVATTEYSTKLELDRAQALLDLGVEALIVSGLVRNDGFEERLARYGVPYLATSRFEPSQPVPSIGYDNMKAAMTAWWHLTNAGHKEIAVLSGPTFNNDRTRARVQGLRDMIGPKFEAFEAGQSIEDAAALCEDVLRLRPETTAILGLSDVVAQGVLFACRKRGISVPDQMSVMGIDDLPSSAYTVPPLTSLHLPVRRMGEAVSKAVSAWLSDGIEPGHVEIDAHIVERATIGPPRMGPLDLD